MNKTRKLQLKLDLADARVLVAALSTLPILINGETLSALVVLLTGEERTLVGMSAAMMAGAVHAGNAEAEMSKEALAENIKRISGMLDKLHAWIEEKEAAGDGADS